MHQLRAMIVVASLLVGTIHVAATLAREKETGTIEQLMVTPLTRSELIVAKIVPTLTIGMLSLLPSLAIVYWFQVPVKGSLVLFFLTSALAQPGPEHNYLIRQELANQPEVAEPDGATCCDVPGACMPTVQADAEAATAIVNACRGPAATVPPTATVTTR